MLIRILIVIIITACKTNSVSYDYPVEKQKEVVANQAKYGTLHYDFGENSKSDRDIKNTEILNINCNLSQAFAMQNFTDFTIVSDKNDVCIINANKTDYNFNIIFSKKNREVVAFKKTNSSMLRDNALSQQYTVEFRDFLEKNE